METWNISVNIIFILLLSGGFLLTSLGFSGNFLILLAGVAYGYYDGFEHVDYAILVILFGAYILGEGIDFVAGLLGAKRAKASKRTMLAAVIGSLLGGILGTALLPVIGSLLGVLAGTYSSSLLAEYSKTQDAEQAKRVAAAVLKGQLLGTMIKCSVAAGMIITLIYNLSWK